jgi:Zn-dependent protease
VCAQAIDSSGTPPPPGAPPRRGNRITPIQWVGLAVLVLLILNQMGLLRGVTGVADLVARLPYLVALVLAITIHEFSHGFVATLFGDGLPRRVGRLTLNPLKHLDPLGTIMILIGPIGWGRPMPINPGEMRNPSLGWAMSSIAGPVSNVLAAAVVWGLYVLFDGSRGGVQFVLVYVYVSINIALAVFNLLPVPPLDGFGFLYGLAPRPVKVALLPLQRYGPLLLLAVLFIPASSQIVGEILSNGRQLIMGWLGVPTLGI